MPLLENSDANMQNIFNFEYSTQVPNGNWDCCAYGTPDGQSIFVAGSNVNLNITSLLNSQMALYSYDGVIWHQTTSFTRISNNKVNFKSIAYGTFDNIPGYEGQNKGVFTAVTSSSIFHSFNGIDWHESNAVPKNYNNVSYGMFEGKGTFVAVGNGGEVSFSRNGISYNYLGGPLQFSINYNSVTYGIDLNGQGVFVAVGQGAIMRSYSGGADWTQERGQPSSSQTWTGVTYAGNYFITVAGAVSLNTFRSMRSKDGITWERNQINNGGEGYGYGADMSRIWKNLIAYNGYVMALSSNTGWGPQVILSDDFGLNWSTSSVSLTNPDNTTFGGIAAGNNILVITGNNNSAAYVTNILPRSNPILSSFSFGSPKRLNDIPAILYLDQFKPQSTSSAPFMYSSSNTSVATITNEGNGDQINYFAMGITTIRATQRHLGTIFNSSDISATLEIRAPTTISQSIRPDGVWDFGMAEGLTANYTWNSGAYGNPNGQDRYVFVGNGNKIMLSSDGINWSLSSQVITDPNGYNRVPGHNFRSVTYGIFNDVGRFCAVTSHGQYYSEDGITFNACGGNDPSTPSNAVAYGVINGIPKAVAVGAIFDATYSFVLISEDGLGYSKRAYVQPRITTSWNALTFGLVNGVGTFLAVGSAGGSNNVMTSTDGENWTIINTGQIQNLWAVAYGNGVFIALGTGMGMRSVDGVNWIRIPGLVGNQDAWRQLLFLGGNFIAVASSIGNIIDPSNQRVAISSNNGQTWDTPIELNETSKISYFAMAAGNNKLILTGNQTNIENRTRYITGITPKSYPSIAPWSIDDQELISLYYPSGLFYGYKNLNLLENLPKSSSQGGWTFVSSDPLVAEVIGNTLVIKKLGTITLTADQAPYSNFSAATLRTTFGIKNQVTLSNFTVPNKTVLVDLGQQFLINAPTFSPPASNPNNSFTYTSSDPSVVSIVDGNNYKIMGRGSAIITARQASTNLYVSKSISATITVDGVKPMITNFKIPRKTMDDLQVEITVPLSNNPNPFTYYSSNPAVAVVNGSILTIMGMGSTEITASQQGTTYFNDAFIKTTFYVAAAGFSLIIDATDATSVESAFADTAINPPRIINLMGSIEITDTLSSTNSFSLYGSNVSIKKKIVES